MKVIYLFYLKKKKVILLKILGLLRNHFLPSHLGPPTTKGALGGLSGLMPRANPCNHLWPLRVTVEEVKPPKSYFYHSTTRIHTLSMVIKLKGLATCYIKLSSFNSLLQQQSCIKNKFYLVSLCSFIIIYFLFFLSFFLLLSLFFLWLSLSLSLHSHLS